MTMALLAGCANRPDEKASSDQISATQDRLTVLAQQLAGSRRDRLAGEMISYHIYQDGLVSCMADEGFTYQPPPFVDPTLALRDPMVLHSEWLDPPSDDFGLIWLARAQTIVSRKLSESENVHTPYEALSPAVQAKYDDALDHVCDNGDDSAYVDANFPKGFSDVFAALTEVLDRVGKKLDGYRGEFVACMASHGVDVSSTRADMFNELVYSTPSYPEALDPKAVDSWNDWVGKVKQAATTDATCRRDAYEVGMTLLEPELDTFEKEHSADIQSVIHRWREMVEKASSYPEFAESLQVDRPSWPGWDGQAPSVG
jgi:hypothetical protein